MEAAPYVVLVVSKGFKPPSNGSSYSVYNYATREVAVKAARGFVNSGSVSFLYSIECRFEYELTPVIETSIDPTKLII